MLRLWLRGIRQASQPAATRWLHVLAAAGLPGDRSSSSNSAPSPLQRRLAEAGVPDWRAFGKPHHAALVGEAEVEQFAAKVAELVREGVTTEDVDRLFAQHDSPHACSLEGVFLPNLAYLRGLLAGAKSQPKRGEPAGLTPLGRLLRRQPKAMAMLLSRTPDLIRELDRWVCGELGVAQEDLAAAALKHPHASLVRVDRGRSVVTFFEEKVGLARGEVVSLFLRRPVVFNMKPDTLRGKIIKLGTLLGIDLLRAGQLVASTPSLFTCSFKELPAVLSELDALFSKEGAGVELVIRAPIVAGLSLSSLRSSVEGLENLGFDQSALVALVEFDPTVLTKNLGSEVQQEKLAWAAAELKWSLQKMFANNLFSRSLRRMASRLAFLRHLGLPDPGSLDLIGKAAEPKFLGRLSKRVGREVGKAEFDAFVAEWECTEQGRRYGFKPDTVPSGRRKSKSGG